MTAETSISAANVPHATLDFLWLELTNRCNLECRHCYADSSPHASPGLLSVDDYREILQDASRQGCRSVQFIGGEPTLNPLLPELIAYAHELEFEMIEVYTNLVRLPERLLACFIDYRVNVATSIYSANPATHDAITTRSGSWAKTVQNLRRVLEARLSLRASVIEMEENRNETQATLDWLHSLGVTQVGSDKAREFGRARREKQCSMGELCGECSKGTLCVGSDGIVAPCIMSKAWPVGSLPQESLRDILASPTLRDTRERIHAETIALRETTMGGCNPDRPHRCGPDHGDNCQPCSPKQNCGPNDCRPKRS